MEHGNVGNVSSESDLPPGLSEMFINSIDTLRKREINQAISNEWNDRPPLFYVAQPKKRGFLWKKEPQSPEVEDYNEKEYEDPNLLKGVSRKHSKNR